MDNIAQYPKDWYKAIVRKTKPRKKESAEEERKTDGEDDNLSPRRRSKDSDCPRKNSVGSDKSKKEAEQ